MSMLDLTIGARVLVDDGFDHILRTSHPDYHGPIKDPDTVFGDMPYDGAILRLYDEQWELVDERGPRKSFITGTNRMEIPSRVPRKNPGDPSPYFTTTTSSTASGSLWYTPQPLTEEDMYAAHEQYMLMEPYCLVTVPHDEFQGVPLSRAFNPISHIARVLLLIYREEKGVARMQHDFNRNAFRDYASKYVVSSPNFSSISKWSIT